MRLLPVFVAVLALAAAPLASAQAEAKLSTPNYRFDRATLRAGAEFFATNCTACHSLGHIRYRRLASDLDMSDDMLERIFPQARSRPYDVITSAMSADAALKAFGVAPPDLTLEARYRGTKWIYSYLKGFYSDPSRPTGFNNHVFPNVAMPDILAGLQGIVAADGSVISKGSVSPAEFDRDIEAVTAWLQYTSDPSKLERRALGPWVIAFLVVFTLLAYALKRVVWRPVH
jgi:ubiquinol-cytochrome c reductase cytochrome c1 subunit